MAADMTYDGKNLKWATETFKATSGLLGHQRADQQNQKEHGPIPEGTYRLLAKDVGVAKSVNGNFVVRPGIETLPPNPQLRETWGPDRVFLEIVSIDRADCRGRNGFYLHDSQKGYTHGCIEVEPRFFARLRDLALRSGGKLVTLELRVKYPSPQSKTYGGTDPKRPAD